MRNLNRKFRKALSIASLGALGCVQSVNINAASTADFAFEVLLKATQEERQDVFNTLQLTGGFNLTKVGLIRLGPTETTKIGKNGNRGDFIQVGYSTTIGAKGQFVMLKDWKTNNISFLPYSTDLLALLKLSYSSLPSEWDPSVSAENERKCWEKTDEFIKCFKENCTGKKDTKDEKDEYGLTPLQKGLLGLAIAGVAGVAGVWAISKIINSVGEAGGKIIHGNNPKIVIKH